MTEEIPPGWRATDPEFQFDNLSTRSVVWLAIDNKWRGQKIGHDMVGPFPSAAAAIAAIEKEIVK